MSSKLSIFIRTRTILPLRRADKIDDMVDEAIKMGMPAIALTDHGSMYGAIEFLQKMPKGWNQTYYRGGNLCCP